MKKVLYTIKIEKLEGGAFNVVQGDKYADGVSWDEMLGLISALTIAANPICLQWMNTKEEHEAWLNSLKKSNEDILVPKEIEIYSFQLNTSDYGDGLFIAFNNNKQLLGFCDTSYCVKPRHLCYLKPMQCKLTPCKRENLKAGDTACADLLDNFNHKFSYCKILSETEIVYPTSDNGVSVTSAWNEFKGLQWYKVVPV